MLPQFISLVLRPDWFGFLTPEIGGVAGVVSARSRLGGSSFAGFAYLGSC